MTIAFSPANYLATFLVEEFGFPFPDQQHIDLFEEKLSAAAAEQHISLDHIPTAAQIKTLFSTVQVCIDLDQVFMS
ncbi:MAG TPA: hypothetical protein VI522_02875 [Gammaproteobacteria bacterium]|nr:hypothetical protein [Gammaproteobacteria bacterium]